MDGNRRSATQRPGSGPPSLAPSTYKDRRLAGLGTGRCRFVRLDSIAVSGTPQRDAPKTQAPPARCCERRNAGQERKASGTAARAGCGAIAADVPLVIALLVGGRRLDHRGARIRRSVLFRPELIDQ